MKKNSLIKKFNLQLFGDDPGAGTDPNTDPNQDPEKNKEPKTYTEDELKALLDSEADRRVSKALETAKAKWQTEFEGKLEMTKKEAEEFAKLSEKEKADREFQKQKEAFENERKTFLMEKMELQLVKDLSEKKLPIEFSKYLLREDAEKTLSAVTEFEKIWADAINNEIEARIKGNTIKSKNTQPGDKITQEVFDKMSYQERVKLKNENKVLYDKFTKK